MAIINKTKNTVIAEKVVIADKPLKRMKGLLGRRDFRVGEALVIKPCNSIHTFFMRFPIDVLFVDRDNRVIKAISNLKPFRLTAIHFNAALVIELPQATIQSTATQKSDCLIFD